MHLRVLTFEHSDPHFNLAFEEAMARSRAEGLIPDTLRVWVNNRAVVLGYFRDAEKDVNLQEAERARFPIIRRFTGGGTVYHDEGCVNYSIVIKRDVEFPISYLYETVLNGTLMALREIGVKAELRNTNDVVIKERKVSGTAASIRWGVLFLHGSILLNADLKQLTTLLKIPEDIKPSVDPVKYRVANLSDFVDVDRRNLIAAIIKGYSKVLSSDYSIEKPTKVEIRLARLLHREKYSRKEWNMEKPPKIDRKTLEEKIKEVLG